MDWDPAFFKGMSIGGHVRYGQQTVYDAEFHAALAANSDTFWIDPVTGVFTIAPVPDGFNYHGFNPNAIAPPPPAHELAPDLFPDGILDMHINEYMNMVAPAAPVTEYEHAAPPCPTANY